MNVAKLLALCTGRLYNPGNIPGTPFYQRLSLPQGHSTAWRIKSMKNPKDPIGNRTRDLLADSATECPEVKNSGALHLSRWMPSWRGQNNFSLYLHWRQTELRLPLLFVIGRLFHSANARFLLGFSLRTYLSLVDVHPACIWPYDVIQSSVGTALLKNIIVVIWSCIGHLCLMSWESIIAILLHELAIIWCDDAILGALSSSPPSHLNAWLRHSICSFVCRFIHAACEVGSSQQESKRSVVPGHIFPFHTCIRQWEAELCLRTNS